MFTAVIAFGLGFGVAWGIHGWHSHQRKAAIRNFRKAFEPGPRP